MTISLDETYRSAIRLHQQGRALDAAVLYDEILAAQPDHYGALHLKGVLALQSGETDRAIDLIRRSLKSKPDHALALANLGVALRLAKRFEGAVTALRQAVKLDADLPDAWANLSMLEARTGALREALVSGRRALSLRPNFPGLAATLLYVESFLAEIDPVASAQRARAIGDAMQRETPPRTDHTNHSDPLRRLRVGLVSNDLGSRNLKVVLRAVDPTQMEFFIYAGGDRESVEATGERLPATSFVAASAFTDGELDERIAADQIDVLIDLDGQTQGNRLAVFASKPAPVAFTWLGSFATTGLTSIDYVLGDARVIPSGEESQWVERVWRLPDAYLCYSPPHGAPAVSPLAAATKGSVTFGSFTDFNKLSDVTLRAWSQLLQEVPDSRLILRSSGRATQGLSSRLASAGIKSARVRIDPPAADAAGHFAGFAEIDIALDSFPNNTGAFALDALYMGVPVIGCVGDRFVGHIGESLLHAAGLSDWVAADAAGVAAIGGTKTADLAALATLRAGLRERLLASPLMDAPRFARHFETAVRGMWQAWCTAQRRA